MALKRLAGALLLVVALSQLSLASGGFLSSIFSKAGKAKAKVGSANQPAAAKGTTAAATPDKQPQLATREPIPYKEATTTPDPPDSKPVHETPPATKQTAPAATTNHDQEHIVPVLVDRETLRAVKQRGSSEQSPPASLDQNQWVRADSPLDSSAELDPSRRAVGSHETDDKHSPVTPQFEHRGTDADDGVALTPGTGDSHGSSDIHTDHDAHHSAAYDEQQWALYGGRTMDDVADSLLEDTDHTTSPVITTTSTGGPSPLHPEPPLHVSDTTLPVRSVKSEPKRAMRKRDLRVKALRAKKERQEKHKERIKRHKKQRFTQRRSRKPRAARKYARRARERGREHDDEDAMLREREYHPRERPPYDEDDDEDDDEEFAPRHHRVRRRHRRHEEL